MCCPHEWLLIASRPGQGLGLVGPPSRTRFDRVCPWPLPGPETGSFLVQGSLDRPCLPFDGVEVVTMGCCFARTSQAEETWNSRSEMSQPSDGLDLSYRITPEYMSRCSQIHTATRLTKLTSISTYYCSIYCCFCFPIPKSSLQVIQTMAPSGYITAKISVKM